MSASTVARRRGRAAVGPAVVAVLAGGADDRAVVTGDRHGVAEAVVRRGVVGGEKDLDDLVLNFFFVFMFQ